MGKWFDANGVDVDAYPERAFHGGVYDYGILGRKSEKRISGRPTEVVEGNDGKADNTQGTTNKGSGLREG